MCTTHLDVPVCLFVLLKHNSDIFVLLDFVPSSCLHKSYITLQYHLILILFTYFKSIQCHSIAWDLRVYNEFACVGDDDALFFFFFDDTKVSSCQDRFFPTSAVVSFMLQDILTKFQEEFAFNVYRTGLYASTVIDRRKEGRASVPYQKELPACTCLAYTSHGMQDVQ